MRIFRKKPFYWGTKEVVRYLRYKYSGHDLVQRFAVYNALCEIESDFDGKPITSFAKVISRYSGIKRQNINTIIKEFQQLGIVSTYRRPKKDGKFGCKYLVLEDKVPSVPKKDTGENSLRLPLFGEGVDKKERTSVPITDDGKQDIFKKVNNVEIKSNLAAGKPSAHKQFIEFWYETVQRARMVRAIITGKDARNLKRVLDMGILSQSQLEQLAAYFLAHPAFRKFSPSIATFLSAGILTGLMNRAKNDAEFWKELDVFTSRYLRIKTQDQSNLIVEKLEKLKAKLFKESLTPQARTQVQEDIAAEERSIK